VSTIAGVALSLKKENSFRTTCTGYPEVLSSIGFVRWPLCGKSIFYHWVVPHANHLLPGIFMLYDRYYAPGLRLIRILRTGGLVHFIRRGIYRLLYQPFIRANPNPHFFFEGKQYRYCLDSYSAAFVSERAVEVPIFAEMIASRTGKNSKRILEVGNVLSHYMPCDWDVVDKYEKAPRVLNVDVEDFHPVARYDTIVSVSTFEHIGFNEEPRDDLKVERCISHVVHKCLAPKGLLVLSIPIGWNKGLDDRIRRNGFRFDDLKAMIRVHRLNRWVEVPVSDDVFNRAYDMVAQAIIVAYVRKK
jgi:hypothetical protein